MKNIKYYFTFFFLFLILIFNGVFADEIEKNCESYIIDNVDYINQDKLVSGCESVASAMLLKFWGYDISEEYFYDNILLHKDWNYQRDGMIHAADPNSAYVGNARKPKGLNCGFGCYAPVLFDALNKVLDTQKHKLMNVTGVDIDELCTNYISKDYPVIIYATMGMVQPKPTYKWKVSFVNKNSKLKIGDIFTWLSSEHCILLIGYSKHSYIVNDSLKKVPRVSIPKSLLKRRYKEMGMQALVIVPTESNVESSSKDKPGMQN